MRRFLLTAAILVLLSGCGMEMRQEGTYRTPAPFEPPTQGLMATADGGGTVTVLSNPARSRLYAIPVPGTPQDIASVGEESSEVIVSSRRGAQGKDALLRLDVRTREPRGMIAFEFEDSIGALALSPDAANAAVLAEATSEVLIVDLEEGTVLHRLELSGETLRDVAWLLDGRIAVAAGNAVRFMNGDGGDPASVDLDGPAVGLAITPRGVAAVVSLPAQLVVIEGEQARSTLELPDALGPIAASVYPDGTAFMVSDAGLQDREAGQRAWRVQPGEEEPVAITVGLRPGAVAVDGAGVAWVLNTVAGTVTILNPDGSFGLEIPVGSSPRGIVRVAAPPRR